MSRWAINDYSDEEEDQQDEDQNEDQLVDDDQQKEQPQANQDDKQNAESDNEPDNNNRSNLSNKQKKFLDLKESLANVLENITQNNLKKAHEEFTKLQNIYKRPPKVIKKNENPRFFIRQLFEITQKVKGLDVSGKDFRKFEQDVKKFSRSFEKELQDCQENPDKFADENDDDDDIDDDFQDDDDDDDDDDGGGWFVSEEKADASKPKDSKGGKESKADSKSKQSHRKDMTSADAVEARLKAERNRAIDDDTAKKELEEYSASRTKGKIITTVTRLYDLYQAAMDKELGHKLQLEICFTVEEGPSDQAIPLEDWTLILDFLPSLINDAKLLVPLFERLNRD